MNQRGKNKIKVFLYLALAFLLLTAITVFTAPDAAHIQDRAALDGHDFSSRAVMLSPNIFDKYPEALLTPEDFAAGAGDTEIIINRSSFFASTAWRA